jgi:ferredoxin
MKAVVDRGKCCGYGLCAETCPEIYHLDECGFAYSDETTIPPELELKAQRGAGSCPERAITLVGDR